MKAVVYFGSREIYPDIKRSINSLLAHTKVDRLFVLAEDDQLDIPAEVINVSKQEFFYPDGPNYNTKWKMFGLIRAAMPKIFPDLDTILSLDADTIILDDISGLFEVDLGLNYFAAVREPYLSTQRPYYNTGVCLLNLKLMRGTGMDDILISALNTNPFRYVSQDAMNYYCDSIMDLPCEYNQSMFTSFSFAPKIRHYANETNWRGLPEVKRWDV